MSMIERHLPGAMQEVASEVPETGVPPLRLPDGTKAAADGGLVRGGNARRWLAPTAAAAAMLVILTSVAVVASLRHASPELSDTGRSDKVPAYYVALTEDSDRDGEPALIGKATAQIYATATGRPVATLIPASLNLGPPNIFTAAADDRTFAFAGSKRNSEKTRFYLAKFDPATRRLRVFALPRALTLAGGSELDSLALSPDGTKLAFTCAGTYDTRVPVFQLTVYDLATGAIRTWTSTRGAFTQQDFQQQSLSWADDNRTVAFSWYTGWQPNPGDGASGHLRRGAGVRLLDTSGAGGDLVSHSRLVLPFTEKNHEAVTPAGYPSPPLLAPDGNDVVATIVTFDRRHIEIGTFSTATGKLTRIVDRRPLSSIGGPQTLWKLLWVSPDGQTLLVFAPPGHAGKFALFRGSHLTLLPTSGKLIYTVQGAPPAW